MPLRDVLRGVASFAEATEDILAPLKDALPPPVRTTLRSALRTIEGHGAEIVGGQVDLDDIGRASAFLRGVAHEAGDAECCAKVLAFAWEKMTSPQNLRPLLSETLSSLRMSTLGDAHLGAPSNHAALVLKTLRDGHVAGGLPGVSSDLSHGEQEAIDLRLFAFAIWLLADPGQTLDEEMQLLDMAMALTQAFGDDVSKAMVGEGDLVALLETLSDHL